MQRPGWSSSRSVRRWPAARASRGRLGRAGQTATEGWRQASCSARARVEMVMAPRDVERDESARALRAAGRLQMGRLVAEPRRSCSVGRSLRPPRPQRDSSCQCRLRISGEFCSRKLASSAQRCGPWKLPRRRVTTRGVALQPCSRCWVESAWSHGSPVHRPAAAGSRAPVIVKRWPARARLASDAVVLPPPPHGQPGTRRRNRRPSRCALGVATGQCHRWCRCGTDAPR